MDFLGWTSWKAHQVPTEGFVKTSKAAPRTSHAAAGDLFSSKTPTSGFFIIIMAPPSQGSKVREGGAEGVAASLSNISYGDCILPDARLKLFSANTF